MSDYEFLPEEERTCVRCGKTYVEWRTNPSRQGLVTCKTCTFNHYWDEGGAEDKYPVDQWMDDLIHRRRTQQEIADEHGIKRQRVSQIIRGRDPDWIEKRKEVDRRKQWYEDIEGVIEGQTECRTCGTEFNSYSSKKKVYCSRECREIWGALRRVCDEEEWRKHTRSVARWSLANMDHHSVQDALDKNPHLLHYWQRIVEDRWDEIEHHGRWLIEGGKNFDNAVRAVEEGWPIADRFHPDVKKQINEHIVAKRTRELRRELEGEQDDVA